MYNTNAEMPVLSELLATVSHIGAEATQKVLINARNKPVTIKDEPKVQTVINAVLEEFAISFEQLIARNTRGLKQRQGLLLVSYCLTELEYPMHKTGSILDNRHKSQINRYHKTMLSAKSPGKLAKLKSQFDILISSLKHKKKTKSNGSKK